MRTFKLHLKTHIPLKVAFLVSLSRYQIWFLSFFFLRFSQIYTNRWYSIYTQLHVALQNWKLNFAICNRFEAILLLPPTSEEQKAYLLSFHQQNVFWSLFSGHGKWRRSHWNLTNQFVTEKAFIHYLHLNDIAEWGDFDFNEFLPVWFEASFFMGLGAFFL